MKKILIVILVVLGIYLIYFLSKNDSIKTNLPISSPASTSKSQTKTYIVANFKIITNGTARIFTDTKYHNLSEDVYIDPSNTNQVVVTKSGITWEDFFKTLPMSLTKDCLITGTKQKFCTDSNGKLEFLINGKVDLDALNRVIKNDDSLLVEYK